MDSDDRSQTLQASASGMDLDRTLLPRNNALRDNVYLKHLSLTATIGADAWGRFDKPQPVLLSVRWYKYLPYGSDSLETSLSYSKMSKDILSAVEARRGGWASAQSFAEFIHYVATDRQWGGVGLAVEVWLPKALLQAGEGLKVKRAYYLKEGIEELEKPFAEEELFPRAVVGDVRAFCVIGVSGNVHERRERQMVRVDLEVEEDLVVGSKEGVESHWRGLVKQSVEVSEVLFSIFDRRWAVRC